MHITIYRQTLTDGSEVFDVVLTDDGSTTRFHCCSEQDAVTLMAGITALIERHTTERVSGW